MNLATTISIMAGGPGSGCNGPNCGRPLTAALKRWSAESSDKFNQERKRIDSAITKGKSHPILDAYTKINSSVHRGMQVGDADKIWTAKTGDTITLGATSFTKDKGVAEGFSLSLQSGEGENPVLMTVEGGLKGVDVTKHVGSDEIGEKAGEKEVISHGQFKVVSVRMGTTSGFRVRIVKVRAF